MVSGGTLRIRGGVRSTERGNKSYREWTEKRYKAPAKLTMDTYVNHERREQ